MNIENLKCSSYFHVYSIKRNHRICEINTRFLHREPRGSNSIKPDRKRERSLMAVLIDSYNISFLFHRNCDWIGKLLLYSFLGVLQHSICNFYIIMFFAGKSDIALISLSRYRILHNILFPLVFFFIELLFFNLAVSSLFFTESHHAHYRNAFL